MCMNKKELVLSWAIFFFYTKLLDCKYLSSGSYLKTTFIYVHNGAGLLCVLTRANGTFPISPAYDYIRCAQMLVERGDVNRLLQSFHFFRKFR